jgi:hypothetical protein
MRNLKIFGVWLLAGVLCAAPAAAQVAPGGGPPGDAAAAAAPELPGPPIQRIETASALSTELLSAIHAVRELPDGRVLVNDGARRRLLLMDTTLTTVAVVLDSVSDVMNTYGIRTGGLIPFRGDSTLFVDPASVAIVVLDEQARIVRVRSVWSAQDAIYYASNTGFYGIPGTDARGRVVYRVPARATSPQRPPAGHRGPWFPPQPDSAFVVAVDLDTRAADTLGVVRIPRQELRPVDMGEGRFGIIPLFNPLPQTDDWAVLSDGTVAFLRGLDYRVDFLNPDGSWSSSEKLPYEWQRLGDADKVQVMDSVRAVQQLAARNSHITQVIVWSNQHAMPYPDGFEVPGDYTPPAGLPRDWIYPPDLRFPAGYVHGCAPGEEPEMIAAPAAAPADRAGAPGVPTPAAPPTPSCMRSFYSTMVSLGGTVPPVPTPREVLVVAPTELPDYRPPFGTNAVRADMDGNLWIRPILPRPVPGGIVYDIVSRDAGLVRRIQLPPGYTLVGFGRGGVVYLSLRDASGMKLARVRLR